MIESPTSKKKSSSRTELPALIVDSKKYRLGKTLGTGATSKVKLGRDESSGKLFAIKVFKRAFQKYMKTEDIILKKLEHKHLVNMEKSGIGTLITRSGEKKVLFLILELASKGELFDYVSETWMFLENTCRHFFKQLMSVLQYIHSEGVSHRDLKLQNFLLDDDFNLKLVDFGFSADEQKVGPILYSMKGTSGYKAPEIEVGGPYLGEKVDIFSAGVNLFVLATRTPPFRRASSDDRWYSYICSKDYEEFWTLYEEKCDLSPTLKDLIGNMIAYKPKERFGIKEVMEHEWMKGDIIDQSEVVREFKLRKEVIEEKIKKTRRNLLQTGKKEMVGVYRNMPDLDSMSDEEEKDKSVTMKIYDEGLYNPQQVFSSSDPDDIFYGIQAVLALNEDCVMSIATEHHYTMKVKFEELDFGGKIRIYYVNDGLRCIDFTKTEGNYFEWKKFVSELLKDETLVEFNNEVNPFNTE